MADVVDVKDAKRKARNGGIIIGVLSTIAAGVLIEKTCNKNVITGATTLCDKGYNAVKGKIDQIKSGKKSSK